MKEMFSIWIKLVVPGGHSLVMDLVREERGVMLGGGKAFLVNAVGAKEKPIVIWNRDKPRCFRGFDIS